MICECCGNCENSEKLNDESWYSNIDRNMYLNYINVRTMSFQKKSLITEYIIRSKNQGGIKLKNKYKIISPDCKTLREFDSEEDMLPSVGDCARVDGIDYIVFKVATEHDFDNLVKLHAIYLDNIQDDV